MVQLLHDKYLVMSFMAEDTIFHKFTFLNLFSGEQLPILFRR